MPRVIERQQAAYALLVHGDERGQLLRIHPRQQPPGFIKLPQALARDGQVHQPFGPVRRGSQHALQHGGGSGEIARAGSRYSKMPSG